MIRFYGYANCSTCRKARAYLLQRGLQLNEIDITTTPPPKALLHSLVSSGHYSLPELFNRSGQLYRALLLSEKLKGLSLDAQLDLLATHGKLVKRPIITDGTRHTVGFDASRMQRIWG